MLRDEVVVRGCVLMVLRCVVAVERVAVKEGNENNEAILALVEALKSDEVKAYMEETFQGSVVPLF